MHALLKSLLQLEPNSACSYDDLSIYDGADLNAERIDILCGTLTQPISFLSTSNVIYLTFDTDGSNTYRGFSATLTVIQP